MMRQALFWCRIKFQGSNFISGKALKTKKIKNIMNLLTSRNHKSIYAGINSLVSEKNPDLLIYFLSHKSFVSGLIYFHLVPLFQDNPSLWEIVREKIPSHRRGQITRWLPCTILTLPRSTIKAFCTCANVHMRSLVQDFPKLSKKIFTKTKLYYCAQVSSGESISEGIGWSFSIVSEYIGPGDAIHREEWKAVAHHPERRVIFVREQSDSMLERVWMEAKST
jgi:hypothetical protein